MSGIELIIGAVGFGVSIPGVILGFKQTGEYIIKRIDQYQNAEKEIRELRTFGESLHAGQISLSLDLAAWALNLHKLDDRMKEAIESHLGQLKKGLVKVSEALDKLYGKNGEFKRGDPITYFLKRREVKLAVADLKKWNVTFSSLISLIEMWKHNVPETYRLTHDRFRETVRADGDYLTPIPDAPEHIALAWGEKRDTSGRPQRVQVLIETKHSDLPQSYPQVKEVAECLAEHLVADTTKKGLLSCLGFREQPSMQRAELIFEVPKTLGNPRTLRSIIEADVGLGYGGRHPLEARLQLARRISECIVSVHTFGLVHKNIRPETILIFENDDIRKMSTTTLTDTVSTTIGKPFLVDWSLVRRVNDLTHYQGSTDWVQNIYRHPRRQGQQIQDRYNMGHDIYSLGVVLLEIGLWEPLIDRSNPNQPYMCSRYVSVAYELALQRKGLLREHDTNNPLSVHKYLVRPNITQPALVELARRELPRKMGTVYAEIVKMCLTALDEGGFAYGEVSSDGEVVVAEGVALRFNEVVLKTLAGISLGLEVDG